MTELERVRDAAIDALSNVTLEEMLAFQTCGLVAVIRAGRVIHIWPEEWANELYNKTSHT